MTEPKYEKIEGAMGDFEDNPQTTGQALNTDKELWRRKEGDYYSPSIHVTEAGGIGIDVGGYVRIMTVEEWADAGALYGKARSLLK